MGTKGGCQYLGSGTRRTGRSVGHRRGSGCWDWSRPSGSTSHRCYTSTPENQRKENLISQVGDVRPPPISLCCANVSAASALFLRSPAENSVHSCTPLGPGTRRIIFSGLRGPPSFSPQLDVRLTFNLQSPEGDASQTWQTPSKTVSTLAWLYWEPSLVTC